MDNMLITWSLGNALKKSVLDNQNYQMIDGPVGPRMKAGVYVKYWCLFVGTCILQSSVLSLVYATEKSPVMHTL